MYLSAMNFIFHLWQSFLALHPWGYVITAVLALIAFIKKEAISAATSALSKEVRQYLPHLSKLTLEIRQVCDDKILASLTPDFSGYTLRGLSPPQKHSATSVRKSQSWETSLMLIDPWGKGRRLLKPTTKRFQSHEQWGMFLEKLLCWEEWPGLSSR